MPELPMLSLQNLKVESMNTQERTKEAKNSRVQDTPRNDRAEGKSFHERLEKAGKNKEQYENTPIKETDVRLEEKGEKPSVARQLPRKIKDNLLHPVSKEAGINEKDFLALEKSSQPKEKSDEKELDTKEKKSAQLKITEMGDKTSVLNSQEEDKIQKRNLSSLTSHCDEKNEDKVVQKELFNSASRHLISSNGKVEIVDKRPRTFKPLSPKKTLDAQNTKRRKKVFPLSSERASNINRLPEEGKSAVLESEITILSETADKKTHESVADILARKIDTQAGNEIVRQVKVILNQAQKGEIRINLHPKNLGSVRMNIYVEDKHLVSRIFVESAVARDAFRASLDGLQSKFLESGFTSADIELTWDERGGTDHRGNGQQHYTSMDDRENKKKALREFEVLSGSGLDEFYEKINMVI